MRFGNRQFKFDGVTFTELFSPPYTAKYFVPAAPTALTGASNVPPHVFVGGATINGVPAPDGTTVAVWVEGGASALA